MSNSKKYTIMVVDDNHETVNLLTDILKSANYRVLTATSGKECLERLKKSKTDLVLLDVMMPDMHGREVYKKIKEKYKDEIKIVILSALQFPSINLSLFKFPVPYGKKNFKKIGITDYISKPFTPEELLKKVGAALGKRS